ncbi:gp82 [Sphingomonas phage PAU]|uniref:gp82 n=1 Tax=Sphingomonas phage PAU TaxID=1150991 RepID=UPI00025731DC|nr:gp82 [Sphingomonas phage PAU]AFF28080.1 gp82 [Sphingomonas phage PAU]
MKILISLLLCISLLSCSRDVYVDGKDEKGYFFYHEECIKSETYTETVPTLINDGTGMSMGGGVYLSTQTYTECLESIIVKRYMSNSDTSKYENIYIRK